MMTLLTNPTIRRPKFARDQRATIRAMDQRGYSFGEIKDAFPASDMTIKSIITNSGRRDDLAEDQSYVDAEVLRKYPAKVRGTHQVEGGTLTYSRMVSVALLIIHRKPSLRSGGKRYVASGCAASSRLTPTCRTSMRMTIKE